MQDYRLVDVELEVSLRAREGDRMIVTVRDNGPGVREEGAAGGGISNTRARLEQLYGPRASLSLDSAPGSGAIATLTFPIDG